MFLTIISLKAFECLKFWWILLPNSFGEYIIALNGLVLAKNYDYIIVLWFEYILNYKEILSIKDKFNAKITNEWLTENIKIIKKTFEIRAKKYDNFNYYNMYMLLIAILKNLFDINLFIRKECQINKICLLLI